MGKMTLQQILMQLAGGMGTSIQIFAVTLIFSLPLGLFVALGRMSKNKLLQMIIKVYISVMRGTPLMLQLLVFILALTICSACVSATAIASGLYLSDS